MSVRDKRVRVRSAATGRVDVGRTAFSHVSFDLKPVRATRSGCAYSVCNLSRLSRFNCDDHNVVEREKET